MYVLREISGAQVPYVQKGAHMETEHILSKHVVIKLSDTQDTELRQ